MLSSRAARISGAIGGGLLATGAWLSAHEGHAGAPQRPVYRQAQAGGAAYRVGFAMLPQDPLVGEDVRFDFQVLQVADSAQGAAGRPVAGRPQVRIISSAAPYTVPHVSSGERPGTYSARHRFRDNGQYAIAVSVDAAGDTVGADFPIVVGAGPVVRAAIAVDGIVLLVVGALAYSRWRRRSLDDPPQRAAALRRDAVFAVAGVSLLLGAHMWVSPRVGRLFLPERHFGPVAWDTGTVDPQGPGVPPHDHPPGTPPHGHGAEAPQGDQAVPAASGAPGEAQDVIGTVVPVPGQLVDVVLPMTARVLFDGFVPRVGAAVRRGQKLVTLEHHYVLHDANHLINQRWPLLVRALETRRESLAAELHAARLRRVHDAAGGPIPEAIATLQAVEAADAAAELARLEHARAAKLLSMHDAQITKGDLVRRAVSAPIDGVIEAMNFTQGQLAYENDKLLTILDLSRVWIEARFPERYAARRPPGSMTFTSAALPSLRFEGRLARVASTLDPRTGTIAAYFEVPNRGRSLRVGMRLAGRVEARPAGATAGALYKGAPIAKAAAAPELTLAATIKPKPELTAEVSAPIWGRIEFAGRRLNVGDSVRKGENLVRVVLELSVDERYAMEARAADISAERELAKARRTQAEQQYRRAAALVKAAPDDSFRKQEMQLAERVYGAAQQEDALLARQTEVFKEVMKRRDPRITIVQAPIAGVITDIGFRPGELNRTGEFRRLLTIVDTSRVWLEAQVFEHQSAAVLSGFRRGSFISPGLSSRRALGRPVAVSGALNPETGTLSAIFDVPNPGGALKVGASAQVVLSPN